PHGPPPRSRAHHCPGTVSGCPLSLGPRPSKSGTAALAHASGPRYLAALSPKQLRSMAVAVIPGLRGAAARAGGSSCARARVSPAIPHFEAQYGATWGAVARPQPELRLTITPLPRAIIAGTKWRRTLATPLRFTSIT